LLEWFIPRQKLVFVVPQTTGEAMQGVSVSCRHAKTPAEWQLILFSLTLHRNNKQIQSVPHRKHSVSITKPNRLMLFREIIAVYCENHTKHINTLCEQNKGFLNVKSNGTYIYHFALQGKKGKAIFVTGRGGP
jgi:hypothetical protein